jgi:hypothetical protein
MSRPPGFPELGIVIPTHSVYAVRWKRNVSGAPTVAPETGVPGSSAPSSRPVGISGRLVHRDSSQK